MYAQLLTDAKAREHHEEATRQNTDGFERYHVEHFFYKQNKALKFKASQMSRIEFYVIY